MRITTLDELDALPIGSVILDIDGDAWQQPWGTRAGEWDLASRYDSDLRLTADYLPATVLHIPGRNLVQEAQANAWDEGAAYIWDGSEAFGKANPYRPAEAP